MRLREQRLLRHFARTAHGTAAPIAAFGRGGSRLRPLTLGLAWLAAMALLAVGAGPVAAAPPHYYKDSFPSGGIENEKTPIISWGTLTFTPEAGHGTPTTCEDAAGGYVENPNGPAGSDPGKGQTSTFTAYNCSNSTSCPAGDVVLEGESYATEMTVDAETLPWSNELTEPELGKVRPEITGVRLTLQCIAHGSKVSASGPGEHEPKIAMGTPSVCVTDPAHPEAPVLEKGVNLGPNVSKAVFDAHSGALSCEGGAFTAKTSGSLKIMGYKGNEIIFGK